MSALERLTAAGHQASHSIYWTQPWSLSPFGSAERARVQDRRSFDIIGLQLTSEIRMVLSRPRSPFKQMLTKARAEEARTGGNKQPFSPSCSGVRPRITSNGDSTLTQPLTLCLVDARPRDLIPGWRRQQDQSLHRTRRHRGKVSAEISQSQNEVAKMPATGRALDFPDHNTQGVRGRGFDSRGLVSTVPPPEPCPSRPTDQTGN
jgi:hypothetical protein